jgi:hypothetical protein
MIFGSEFGEVIDHVACTRCEAPAVIRSRKRAEHLFERHLTCHKCHLIEFYGLVTEDNLTDEKLLVKLKALREKAKGRTQKDRIDRKITKVEERMKLHELVTYSN